MILNVTPDHLDRHITFENYVVAKERIFAKQRAEDALVLNWDDPVTRQRRTELRRGSFGSAARSRSSGALTWRTAR